MQRHQARLYGITQSYLSQSLTASQTQIDVSYYDIRLEFYDDYTGFAQASVGVAGRALEGGVSLIELNLDNTLRVDSVLVDGAVAAFTHDDNLVSIPIQPLGAGEDFFATIYYHGRPIAQGFGSFVAGRQNGRPMIATLSEPFFARTWWPCKDHPSDKADSVDLRVTTTADLTVASNGALRSRVDHGDGTATTHWHESYPIASYLVSLAISDYEVYADTFHYDGGRMPVEFYMFNGEADTYRDKNALVVPMLAYFSTIFGEYPFLSEKYGHAQFLWGGGMEHQTCSSMGSFNELVVAHELAHQWWGDLITCGTWHDIWLNEGFARYAEALWLELAYGTRYRDDYLRALQSIDQQVYVADTSIYYEIFDRVVYDKGGWVLHMLRYTVGEADFFRILRSYANSIHKYGSATTDDFRKVCEDVVGYDLQYFFDQWVYQPRIPDYEYGWFAYRTDSTVVAEVLLQQKQPEVVFRTDIDLAFMFGDTSLLQRVTNDRRSQVYRFELAELPTAVNIDPGNWLLNFYTQVELPVITLRDTLPDAYLGIPYEFRMEAVGGEPPFIWSEYEISLPEGLHVSDDGWLAGIPETYGDYEIVVRVRDSSAPPRESANLLSLRVNRLHGNVDDDPRLDLNDALFLMRYLFREGEAPASSEIADANCDGRVDLVDVVTLLNYIYRTGPTPCSSLP